MPVFPTLFPLSSRTESLQCREYSHRVRRSKRSFDIYNHHQSWYVRIRHRFNARSAYYMSIE